MTTTLVQETQPKLTPWEEGIRKAAGDPLWAAYDCDIIMAVNEFNLYLAGKAGYVPLDWQVIKAMLWVESGGGSSEWKVKPMQIGVKGDPGLHALLSGREGGDLILPPTLKTHLNAANASSIPSFNIRAGIAYLLMRMANFDYRTVDDVDMTIQEVTVKSGDSLDKIARLHASTVDTIRQINPNTVTLQPGRVLKIRKASVQRVITGWRQINPQTIAQRYNGGGDPSYDKKLAYALSVVREGKAATCAQ